MQPAPSRFSRFTFTDDEVIQCKVLTNLNLANLQNMRADIMDSRAALDFDPQNPIAFAQSEALLKGQLQMLDLLLAEHEQAQSDNMQLNLDSSDQ